MANSNYQTAISASGWTVQDTSNGVVSGVVQLVIPPSLLACTLILPLSVSDCTTPWSSTLVEQHFGTAKGPA